MYTFILVLLIIDCLVLMAAILLQSGQGSGLASTFGGVSSSADTIFGTRQAGNLLTSVSWWSGGIFLFLSFVLALMSSHSRQPASVLDQGLGGTTPVTAPAPATGTGAAPLPLQTQPATPAPATPAPATPKK